MDVLWSMVLVLAGGFAAGWLVQKVRLPGLLGTMLFGILIGPMGRKNRAREMAGF